MQDSTNIWTWAAATAVERHPGWYTGHAQDTRTVYLIGERSGLRRCDMRTAMHGPAPCDRPTHAEPAGYTRVSHADLIRRATPVQA